MPNRNAQNARKLPCKSEQLLLFRRLLAHRLIALHARSKLAAPIRWDLRIRGFPLVRIPASSRTSDAILQDVDGGPSDALVWATAAVALYGALLATYNAWLSRGRERRDRERHTREQTKERRLVEVGARVAVLPDYPGLHVVAVRALCDGPRPVTINGLHLLLEDGRPAFALPVPVGGRQPLPVVLKDGEEVTIFLDADKVATMEADEGTRVVSVCVTGPADGDQWETPWPSVAGE